MSPHVTTSCSDYAKLFLLDEKYFLTMWVPGEGGLCQVVTRVQGSFIICHDIRAIIQLFKLFLPEQTSFYRILDRLYDYLLLRSYDNQWYMILRYRVIHCDLSCLLTVDDMENINKWSRILLIATHSRGNVGVIIPGTRVMCEERNWLDKVWDFWQMSPIHTIYSFYLWEMVRTRQYSEFKQSQSVMMLVPFLLRFPCNEWSILSAGVSGIKRLVATWEPKLLLGAKMWLE